jgi:hypothetical protein
VEQSDCAKSTALEGVTAVGDILAPQLPLTRPSGTVAEEHQMQDAGRRRLRREQPHDFELVCPLCISRTPSEAAEFTIGQIERAHFF